MKGGEFHVEKECGEVRKVDAVDEWTEAPSTRKKESPFIQESDFGALDINHGPVAVDGMEAISLPWLMGII